MLVRVGRHLRANLVAYLALFVALGGTGAYAASKIGSKDIAKNAVKSKHIKDNQVTGADIKDGSLGAADVPGGGGAGGGCPAGYSATAGLCYSQPASADRYAVAEDNCAAGGARLPTLAEAALIRKATGDYSGWAGDIWREGGTFYAVNLQGGATAGAVTGSSPTLAPYRCVISLKRARFACIAVGGVALVGCGDEGGDSSPASSPTKTQADKPKPEKPSSSDIVVTCSQSFDQDLSAPPPGKPAFMDCLERLKAPQDVIDAWK